MSFPTLSPSIHRCHRTPRAMPCPPRLPLPFLATTSPVQVPRWRSTCPQTTRPCRITYRRLGPRCRGSINMRCCRGWRSRGAGWCNTPRECRRCFSVSSRPIMSNSRFSKNIKSRGEPVPVSACRRAHERPPPHPHRMHPNYGHGHHIHVPQTMSSHPRQPEQRTAWSVSAAAPSAYVRLDWRESFTWWRLITLSRVSRQGARHRDRGPLPSFRAPALPPAPLSPSPQTASLPHPLHGEYTCIH